MMCSALRSDKAVEPHVLRANSAAIIKTWESVASLTPKVEAELVIDSVTARRTLGVAVATMWSIEMQGR